jgi:hypothetical protein
MAITRSDELRHSPTARDTTLSSRVTATIIRSLNTITQKNEIRRNNNRVQQEVRKVAKEGLKQKSKKPWRN